MGGLSTEKIHIGTPERQTAYLGPRRRQSNLPCSAGTDIVAGQIA
jgi:hypothetical protein